MYVRDSKWNPCHPNRFVSLEIEDELENENHYLCLPDLNEYLLFENNPRYNIVTVESVPKSPHNKGGYSDLPYETPSLEASPSGAAAWKHRATSQESEDKRPVAFGSHHCSHPGPLGPAMVSWVNPLGWDQSGPLVWLGNMCTAYRWTMLIWTSQSDLLAAPIKLHASQDARRPAALSNSCNLDQPIKLHAPQDARAQRALYNPCDVTQPINSSGATCNSMHMASSEFSNLDEPITPDNAMEVDSANMLPNNCNLTGPITPDSAMEVDSPNVSINKCNLNEPIKPLNTMETDTPNVLSNNCNSDGPIRPGAAGAKFAHPDQAGCPTPGHPIRSRNTKKTNAPNLLHHNCNPAGPIRSGAASANYIHTDQAGCPVPNQPINPCDTKTTNAPNLLHYDCNIKEPIRCSATGANYTHTILSQSIRYKRDPNWPNQFLSNFSEPMDTFHTPPEWFDPFWVAIN
ncbi:hypothetical protein DSO57_1019907 [Entomophthora muscae]|uniref:Uncharacterized protein n=1 Tax=Entomophthora muscae TaxID=34485 RepID=A0ACC2UDN4_9FUNG|nr:hypothetical protein DSO57_1019907 [Entomophthora muscae]